MWDRYYWGGKGGKVKGCDFAVAHCLKESRGFVCPAPQDMDEIKYISTVLHSANISLRQVTTNLAIDRRSICQFPPFFESQERSIF